MRILVVVVALALTCAGCASVTRGWNEQMQFQSEPSGAELRTSLGHACMTPCTLQFSRKDEFIATFAKPGYIPVQVPVKTRIAGTGAAGFAGNVILGGVIGMGVDAASGATLEHCPNPVMARLQPMGGRPPSRRGTMRGQPPLVEEMPPAVVHVAEECGNMPPPSAAIEPIQQ